LVNTTHTVAVDQFEGPLGLLLDLVEQGRLEVTTISVSQITSDYLARLGQLQNRRSEDVSEFVHLGARLLYIKSLALLPRNSASEQAEELHQLNLELGEYRAIKQAAELLGKRAGQTVWPRPVAPAPRPAAKSHPPSLGEVSLEDLTAAFRQALRRRPPELPTRVITPHINMQTVMENLRRQTARRPVELNRLLQACSGQAEMIVTFLAMLELIRDGDLAVRQSTQFAPITLEANRG
jgi:segregation and condensation protein A